MNLTHIDLFSGIGGFALAAQCAGFQTTVFCEKDKFCQKVLRKHWATVPIVEDIFEFSGKKHTGTTLLTGGFPCQPFSGAGKQRGKEDDRYLWPEMFRIISEARPDWVLAENVTGIINMELDTVLSNLESESYETITFNIPACGVNVPHKRSRVWIVAYINGSGSWGGSRNTITDATQLFSDVSNDNSKVGTQFEKVSKFRNGSGKEALANSKSRKNRWLFKSELQSNVRTENKTNGKFAIWEPEPDVGRVVNGLSSKLDKTCRLRGLGNAIVPQVAYEILVNMAEISNDINLQSFD